VIGVILASDEYRSRVVAGYYTTYLGRTASAADIAFWAAALRNGAAAEQVLAGIVASAGYVANAGGTDTAWLDRLYGDLLGREVDAGGRAFFLNALAQGTRTRLQVAAEFLDSPEYEARLVVALYRDYLRRQASAADIEFWAQALGQGGTEDQVRTAFLTSSEYFQQPHDDL
jgi:hypothetical protein